MKPNPTSAFQSRAWIAFHCLLLVTALGAFARADTLRLKDGTVLEGNIMSEDKTQFVIELRFASGTISTKQIVKKADVAQVIHLTPEQKAQRDMEKMFEQVQEYQLDPNTSEPQSYYDHVINDVFRPFLRLYPQSTHEEEVNQKIAEWTTERDQVAGGLARVGNEWLPRAEAEKRVELARSQRLLDQGQALLVQSNFSQALDQFKAVIAASNLPEPVKEAKHLYAETSLQWYDVLEHQQQSLSDEIKLYNDRMDRTLQKRRVADSKLREANRSGTQADGSTSGPDRAALLSKVQAEYDHATAENADAAAHLTALRRQLTSLEQTMAQAHSCAVLYAVSPLPFNPQQVQPVNVQPSVASQQPLSAGTTTPEQPPSESTFPRHLGQLFARYWIYGVAVLVGGLWVLSRLTTKH
jgi:hypothetical protein